MGLVLWIDQNTFATGLLEKVFKKKNLPFYSLTNAADFLYLVDDLAPESLVLDSKTILDDLEKFKHQYAQSEKLKTLPIILLDPVSELSFITNIHGEIKRPFDPFEIPNRLSAILKPN